MNYGPIVRIFLRYVIGAAFMGSAVIGEQLAADPDVVEIVAVGLGLVVEFAYGFAKKRGWAT